MTTPPPEMAQIYVLQDPRSFEIRYVGWTGRTLAQRLASHIRETVVHVERNNHRLAWVRSLLRWGLRPQIVLVQTVPYSAWKSAERYWIAYFRGAGCPLTNSTVGGEGAAGVKHSQVTRERMSAAWTPERKAAQSARYRGRAVSAEQRAKNSAAAKRQMSDPAQRLAVSRVHRGKTISDEHRRIVGEAAKRRWAEWRTSGRKVSPETSAKIRAGNLGRKHRPWTEDERRQISDRKKQWWAEKKRRLEDGTDTDPGARDTSGRFRSAGASG